MRAMGSNYQVQNILEADSVAMRDICRVTHDSLAYQGWKLDVRPGRGRCIRFFADRDYGSSTKALRAARMARAALLLEEWR